MSRETRENQRIVERALVSKERVAAFKVIYAQSVCLRMIGASMQDPNMNLREGWVAA